MRSLLIVIHRVNLSALDVGWCTTPSMDFTVISTQQGEQQRLHTTNQLDKIFGENHTDS